MLGGLDHLASTCPLVLKELIAKLVSSKKAKIDVDTAFVVVPESDMHQLRYTDTSLNCRTGIAIRIGYADTPIRYR